MIVLCSNQDAILEKGSGDAGTSWRPFVQNVGSHYIDAAGQAKLDTVWKDIKVCRPRIQDGTCILETEHAAGLPLYDTVSEYGKDACHAHT